jgi:hypothetical protein
MKFISDLSSHKLVCSELTVADYKQILKCSFGDEPDLELFSETICDVIGKLTNKSSEFVKSLPMSDVLCILIDLRLKSMGDVVTVSVKSEEKQMSLDLNLSTIKEDIKQFYKPFCCSKITQKDLEIVLSVPSFEMLSTKTDDEYLYFIKSVLLKKSTFEISNIEEASALFEKISAKAASQIISHCRQFIESVKELNLLARYEGIEQKLGFVPTIENLLWFVKLLFNEPLDAFYDNIFYLAKHVNMTPQYIESCTPGEYIYFTKKLEASIAAQNQGNQQQSNFDQSSDGFPEDLRDEYAPDDGFVDL